MLSHPPSSPDFTPANVLFPKLRFAVEGTRFENVSSIQKTNERAESDTERSVFSGILFQFGNLIVTPCMSQYDSMQLQAIAEICEWTMLSDGINTHLLSFLCGFYALNSRN
jgi:hypothetical protein